MKTLYPTGAAHIVGDPLVGSPPALVTECNAPAAKILLSYSPPAFSTEPTPFSDALEADGEGGGPPHPHNTIVLEAIDDAAPAAPKQPRAGGRFARKASTPAAQPGPTPAPESAASGQEG